MIFHSTRGNDSGKTFEEVLMQGLASDGGLFMPDEWPQVDINHIQHLETFIDVAKYIVPMFTKSSFSDEEVLSLLDSTWHDFSEENFVKIHQVVYEGPGKRVHTYKNFIPEIQEKRTYSCLPTVPARVPRMYFELT